MLEIDGTLLIAALSFVIFIFIMNIVFYRPVLEIIQKRREYLSENETRAAEMNKETENISDRIQKSLDEGKKKANALISDGKLKSEKKIAEAKAEFIRENNEKYQTERSENLQYCNTLREELLKNSDEIAKIVKDKLFGGTNV